jgi:hypothetical protein
MEDILAPVASQVHVSPNGQVEGARETLVNPQRDMGAQSIHGITASAAARAPEFSAIAPSVSRFGAGSATLGRQLEPAGAASIAWSEAETEESFVLTRTRGRMQQPTLVLVALALTGLLVSGCSAPAGGESQAGTSGNQGSGEQSAAAPDPGATTDADGFPTCDEVKAALSPALDDLIVIEPSENGVSGGDNPSLTCSWHTPETNSDNINVEEYGGISVGIERDPSYTEESMEPLGWVVDDPQVAAAGAWALKVGGAYNPTDQLDATGVQVVRDGIVVVLTSGGVALQDVPQLASLTNEWAMGAGVKLLDLVG